MTAGLIAAAMIALYLLFPGGQSKDPVPDAAGELQAERLQPEWEFTIPSSANLDAGQALRGPPSPAHSRLTFANLTTWQRFRIENSSSQPQKLVIGAWFFAVRKAVLYEIRDGRPWFVHAVSRHMRADQRHLNYRLPLLKLTVPPGGGEYLLAGEFLSIMTSRFSIWSEKSLIGFSSKENLAMGVVFGLIILMIGYHVLACISIKESSYVYYVLYLGTIGWYIFQFMGFAGLLLPERVFSALRNLDLLILPNIVMIALTAFHIKLLAVERFFPLFYTMVKFLLALTIINLCIGPWLAERGIILLQEANMVIFCAINIGLVNAARRKRLPYYLPFLLSWAVFATGFTLYLLNDTGIIEWNLGSPYILPGFTTLSMLVLSSANEERMKFSQGRLMEARLGTLAATAAQTSFKPVDHIPGVTIREHFESAELAGGDLYGYQYLEKQNRFVFYIGDVTGHGVDSSAISCAISSAIYTRLMGESFQEKDLPLDEALLYLASGTNHLIRLTGARIEKIATLAVGIIDLSSGDGCLLSAGHTPVYCQKSGHPPQALTARGSLLGFRDDPQFTLRPFQFDRDTTLFMYTDGLIENAGAAQEKSMNRNLRRVLVKSEGDPSAIHSGMLELTDRLWGNQEKDDCCFLVFQRAA